MKYTTGAYENAVVEEGSRAELVNAFLEARKDLYVMMQKNKKISERLNGTEEVNERLRDGLVKICQRKYSRHTAIMLAKIAEEALDYGTVIRLRGE